jgi:hypothetical protein
MKRGRGELVQAIGDPRDQRPSSEAHQELLGQLFVAGWGIWSNERLDRRRHEHPRLDQERVHDPQRRAHADRTSVRRQARSAGEQLPRIDTVESQLSADAFGPSSPALLKQHDIGALAAEEVHQRRQGHRPTIRRGSEVQRGDSELTRRLGTQRSPARDPARVLRSPHSMASL